jgi:hypothetical protein
MRGNNLNEPGTPEALNIHLQNHNGFVQCVCFVISVLINCACGPPKRSSGFENHFVNVLPAFQS